MTACSALTTYPDRRDITSSTGVRLFARGKAFQRTKKGATCLGWRGGLCPRNPPCTPYAVLPFVARCAVARPFPMLHQHPQSSFTFLALPEHPPCCRFRFPFLLPHWPPTDCFSLQPQGVVLDYPKGGTEALVDALVRGVEGKGGQVKLAAHVEEVLVEDGNACGVRLRGGKVIRASRWLESAEHAIDSAFAKSECPETYATYVVSFCMHPSSPRVPPPHRCGGAGLSYRTPASGTH